MAPVSVQPLPCSMDAYNVGLYANEKSANQCQIHMESRTQCCCDSEPSSSHHRACHQARLRKLLLPIALLLFAVGAALLISCVYDIDLFDLVSMGMDVSGNSLGRRQTTSSGQSSFTQHKLYLIIVFVGLVLVIVAGIMLSFWCCKGSFENPLCCPCYLCACCGGIACLECIGCGLCAAGLEAA